MKKLKRYCQNTFNEFLGMPRMLQLVLVVLVILLIYQTVLLYFIRVEIAQVQYEFEQLK